MKENNSLAFEVVEDLKEKKIYSIEDLHKQASRGKVKPKRVSIKKRSKSKEVYAFRTKEEIHRVIEYLNLKIKLSEYNDKRVWERNKLLFLIGINVGLRASDLRLLKWEFFFKENKQTGVYSTRINVNY